MGPLLFAQSAAISYYDYFYESASLINSCLFPLVFLGPKGYTYLKISFQATRVNTSYKRNSIQKTYEERLFIPFVTNTRQRIVAIVLEVVL
jgi:hypothetical protein